MSADESPGVLRRFMAYGLREFRCAAGMSQTEVSSQMKCSVSQIAHLEARRRLPRLEFLEKLLTIYGREDQIERYSTMLDHAKTKSSWEGNTIAYKYPGLTMFIGLEEGASQIEDSTAMVFPGLLQCESYARAVMNATAAAREEIEPGLRLRMHRQRILDRDNPVELWVLLDEFVLDRVIGDVDIQRQQLRYALERSQQDNIHIQVVPRDAGSFPGMETSFRILQFPYADDSGVVHISVSTRHLFFEDIKTIEDHARILNHQRALALDHRRSQELIEQKVKEVS